MGTFLWHLSSQQDTGWQLTRPDIGLQWRESPVSWGRSEAAGHCRVWLQLRRLRPVTNQHQSALQSGSKQQANVAQLRNYAEDGDMRPEKRSSQYSPPCLRQIFRSSRVSKCLYLFNFWFYWFLVSGNLGGLTILSIDVHTSSIFIIFMVLSMVFIFITRRSYYYYFDKYYGVILLITYYYLCFTFTFPSMFPVSLFIM